MNGLPAGIGLAHDVGTHQGHEKHQNAREGERHSCEVGARGNAGSPAAAAIAVTWVTTRWQAAFAVPQFEFVNDCGSGHGHQAFFNCSGGMCCIM